MSVNTLRPKVWGNLLGLDYSPIGSTSQRDIIQNLSTTGNAKSVFFIGSSGTGKSSAARLFAMTYLDVPYEDIALAAIEPSMGCPYYKEINASSERGIDAIRKLGEEFTCIGTDNDKCRVLVLDEADGMTPQAQNALRALISRDSYNCIFIFCVNEEDAIILPLYSRNAKFYFNPITDSISLPWFVERCKEYEIDIAYNVAQKVVKYYKGDLRQLITGFLDVYKGETVLKYEPKPTFAEEIYKASDKFAKYEEIAAKNYLDHKQLIHDLFLLHSRKDPIPFSDAMEALQDPMMAVYRILGLL